MPATTMRENVLHALLEYLSFLSGGALVRWRPAEAPDGRWRNRLDWPADRAGRAATWRLLKSRLEADGRAAVIEAWPDGSASGRPASFDWPASQSSLPFPGVPAPAAGQRPDENGVPPLDDPPPPPDEEGEEVRVVRKPRKASRACAAAVIMLLYREQQRMTGAELVSRLHNTPQECGISQVEATCSWMIAEGKLTNGRDERGRGYGLPRWGRRPVEGEDGEVTVGGDEDE